MNSKVEEDLAKSELKEALGLASNDKETKEKLEAALEANRILHEKRASGEIAPAAQDTMQLREDRFDPSNVRMSPLSQEE